VFRAIWEITHGDMQDEPLTQEKLKAKGIGQKQLALALVNFLKLLDGPGCRCRDVVEACADAGKFARLLIDRVVESSDYSKLLPSKYVRSKSQPFRSFGSDKFVAPPTNTDFDQQAWLCLETLNAVVIKLNSPKDGFDWLKKIVASYDKGRKTGQPQGFADADSDRSPNSRRPDDGNISAEAKCLVRQTLANGTEHPSPPNVFTLRCADNDDGSDKIVKIDFGDLFHPKELLVLRKSLKEKYDELVKATKVAGMTSSEPTDRLRRGGAMH